MPSTRYHWNIKLAKAPDRLPIMASLLDKKYAPFFEWLNSKSVQIISPKTIFNFIDEEMVHDNEDILRQSGQTLGSMSSGERKQAFLKYAIELKPDVLILDHFLDNLDTKARAHFSDLIKEQSNQLDIVNIYSRENDGMDFLASQFHFENAELSSYASKIHSPDNKSGVETNNCPLPKAIKDSPVYTNPLISFNEVNVSYLDKCILRGINWEIDKGQFWHLYGPNGSGKTTLLTMIVGDNPKAYGQDIKLFGKQKGTGETIWEIKQKVGYFTTNMTFQFKRLQSARDMIVSGFFDSVGLYQIASDLQIKLANEWLDFIGLPHLANEPFIKLSMCHQRMIMIARAMVKHPPLLILDEASVDLDEESATLMTALINRIAQEGDTTLIYVSHRIEPGLSPTHSFELILGDQGSIGITQVIQ